MDTETTRLLAVICAGLAVVSTVGYFVFKMKELRVLRDIRDKREK